MILALGTLLLTIACETGIALAARAVRVISDPARRLLVDVPLINLLTHPLGTLLVRNEIASFTVVEVMIFVAEWILYRTVTRLSWVQAFLLSLVANGTTVLIALALQHGRG